MKNKIKNLFARIPSNTKGGTGIGIALATFAYLMNLGINNEPNPLKWDKAIETRIEQYELRKKRLGVLAGPIEINFPIKYEKIKMGGMYGNTHIESRPNPEATKIERERVEKLGEKIFGENGYADTNKSGKIELGELADTYTRMGLDSIVMQTGRFPNVTAEHLEKAIQYYESKKIN